MAKYIMQEMPSMNGDKDVIRYPRMLIEHHCSVKQIAQEIADITSFSKGEVEGLIYSITEHIADKLAQGYSVKIDGLGIFSTKLRLRQGFEPENIEGTKRNAASLEVSGVSFRSNKELVRRINQSCHLERAQTPTYKKQTQGQDQRLERLRAYLSDHGFIKVRTYASIMGLSRSSASRELQAFRRDKYIVSVGYSPHNFYILPKNQD